MKRAVTLPGAPMALVSAALFGASKPLAKLLLGGGVGMATRRTPRANES